MSEHKMTWPLELGEDTEVVLTVTYKANPYFPAITTGPSDNWGPAEGGDIEILSVTHNGAPFDLAPDDEKALIEYLELNAEDDEPDPDYLRELRAEQIQMDRDDGL